MEKSPLEKLHRAAGARLAPTGPEALLTFGDVPAEYRAAQEAAALFDETERGLVVVRGGEAGAFLHRMLANDVRGLAEGRGNRNLLLSPKGKVRFDFDLFREHDAYRLSTPPGEARALAEALEAYHFAEELEIRDESSESAPLALLGPLAAQVCERALGLEPPSDDRHVALAARDGAPLRIARLVIHGSPALRIDAGPERAEGLWEALVAAGARPAGRVVADILRIEAGAARAREDFDEEIYPQEARLEAAFALDKGCYVGQEVVAKIDTYGGLNKRLVALAVSHDDPVPSGTRLYRHDAEKGEWRDLGVTTSWAYSFVHDTGLVLAYVKRRHQGVGTVFRLGEGPASARIVAIPARAGAVPVSGDFE